MSKICGSFLMIMTGSRNMIVIGVNKAKEIIKSVHLNKKEGIKFVIIIIIPFTILENFLNRKNSNTLTKE